MAQQGFNNKASVRESADAAGSSSEPSVDEDFWTSHLPPDDVCPYQTASFEPLLYPSPPPPLLPPFRGAAHMDGAGDVASRKPAANELEAAANDLEAQAASLLAASQVYEELARKKRLACSGSNYSSGGESVPARLGGPGFFSDLQDGLPTPWPSGPSREGNSVPPMPGMRPAHPGMMHGMMQHGMMPRPPMQMHGSPMPGYEHGKGAGYEHGKGGPPFDHGKGGKSWPSYPMPGMAPDMMMPGASPALSASAARHLQQSAKPAVSAQPPRQTEQTTVMWKNIPNNYTRDTLLALLDAKGFTGAYDFFYSPVDFTSKALVGYAFVNFVSTEQANRFYERFNGFSDWSLKSEKCSEVNWSQQQGLQGHIDRYRNSPVMHPDVPEANRPLLFQNGIIVEFPPPTKKLRAPHPKDCRQKQH